VNYIQKESSMRAKELGMEPQEGSVGVSLGQESVEGYEQRLIQWGCSKCGFFEKRVFRSGLPHEELDAYIICRFAGELVDLIGEVTACPKNCRPKLVKNKSKSPRGRPHSRYAA
jgi:hypothetical protein